MGRRYDKVPNGIEEKIKGAAQRAGLPIYVIKYLISSGTLSQTLESAVDDHVIDNVLPMMSSRPVLSALLKKLGSPEKQHQFIEDSKEDNPFQSHIRKIIETRHKQEKPLGINSIICELRESGGHYSTYACQVQDEVLKNIIKRIINKVRCAAERKKKKEEGPNQKLLFLRGKLLDFCPPNQRRDVESLNTPATSRALDELGDSNPQVIAEEKEKLQQLSARLRQKIISTCPHASEAQRELWITTEYGEVTFSRISAYAEGRGSAGEDHATKLSHLLFRTWFVLTTIRDKNVVLVEQPEATLELVQYQLNELVVDPQCKNLEKVKNLLSRIGTMTQIELEEVKVWAEAEWWEDL